MHALKIILSILAVIIVLITGFLFYLGMFGKMTVTEQPMGPYVIAYEHFVGPYSKTKTAFDNVYNTLIANGIDSQLGLGIYYDDPSQVSANQLKSDCGSVLTGESISKARLLDGKISIKEIEKTPCLVTTFPIKNPMSYMFGPMRAYPALAKYAKENNIVFGGLSYEVYDMPNKVIYFVFQINEAK